MGATTSREFQWSYTEEPHATRRKEILAAHPEMKNLFGPDRSLPFVVTAMVLTQVAMAFALRDSDWTLVFIQAYLVGATFNHSLNLAIHEISHNLAFGNSRLFANRFFGIFANLPAGIPFSISFKKYHLEHHRYQGSEVLDTDIPTELEGRFFNSTPRKLLWLALQPLFYAFRPLIVYRKAVCDLEVVNLIAQLAFDYFIWQYAGAKGLTYFLFGTFIALGLHPTAGHFISEHYVFHPGYETNSYIGPLNAVMFNVGYHVEHHDFPYIPGCRLPLVRQIAPEWYAKAPVHTSYLWVIWEFLVNPALGPYARIKRAAAAAPDPSTANLLAPYAGALARLLGLSQARDFLVSCLYSSESPNPNPNPAHTKTQ